MSKAWLSLIDQAVKEIESDNVELGLQALHTIQAHGKEQPGVMMVLADVWYQLGHLREARELMEEVLATAGELDPAMRREGQYLLAEIALDEGDTERAQTLLYRLREEGCEDVRLYVLLADLYAMDELDEVAVKYLEQAQAKEPDNQEILSALSELYMRLGRTGEAIGLLDRMAEPDLPALLARARMLANSGQFEEAYLVYQELVKRDRSADVLYGCGLVAYHLGHHDEARALVETLLALEEEYVTAYPLLADISLAKGDVKAAIRALKTYVDLSGFELEPIALLIALLKQTGRDEEAKPYEDLYRQWSEDEDE